MNPSSNNARVWIFVGIGVVILGLLVFLAIRKTTSPPQKPATTPTKQTADTSKKTHAPALGAPERIQRPQPPRPVGVQN